jgi:hypothetical protein
MDATQELARKAFAAMLYRPSLFALEFEGATPMPAGVALDMVMDETGDREAARQAIREAAADDLRERRPDEDEHSTRIMQNGADGIISRVRVGQLSEARTDCTWLAGHIILYQGFEICHPGALGPGRLATLNHFRDWVRHAERVLKVLTRMTSSD